MTTDFSSLLDTEFKSAVPAPSEVLPVETNLPFEIVEKLEKLKADLFSQNPNYVNALAFLQKETALHPEYVYALSDEQILLMVQGYERYTNISIKVGKLSKKSGSLLDANSV